MTKNQTIILIIFIAYLVLNAIIGLLFSKKQNDASSLSHEKKFFIGGRSMNGLVLAMTTMATYTSISSFISGPGAAGATYGYAQVWIAAVQVPVTFLVLGVLGNKLALVSRQTGAVTIVGYLNARYKSEVLVIVISLLSVVFCTAQMIGQFTGGATLISAITGLPYGWALLIFGVVVIIYTSFGGFSAVAITDTFQGFIMCIGTFLLLFYVLKTGGGLSGIDAGLKQNLPGVYDNMFALYSPGALASFWILVGFGTLGLPQTAVRGMGFKDTKSLKSAMIIGCITCSFIMVGMHLAGCWAGGLPNRASIPTSDYFIPTIVQQIMPVGVAGIFLAAPMAAVMSTADSLLILVSAAIIKDLWKTFFVKDNPERLAGYNRHMKAGSALITLAFGVFVMLLALDPPNIIFFLNLFAFGGLECSFLWPLVGGLFWKKGTKEAALTSSIGAVATYIFCYYNVKVAGINAVVWGLLAGGILYFAVGAFTSAKRTPDPEILDNCF